MRDFPIACLMAPIRRFIWSWKVQGQMVSPKNERADIETVISDLLSGQFSDPIEVVAFNTLEHWRDDLSEDIAREIRCRCDIDGCDVPDYLEDFLNRTAA